MAGALALSKNVSGGVDIISFVQISFYKLIFTMNSSGIRGIHKSIFSNASKVGHLQGEDD